MNGTQEEFDLIMSELKSVLKDKDPELSLGALMNVMIVTSMNQLGNACEAYYAVDQLKHQYFAELIKMMTEKEKQL
jgi:hypothetical protein